MQEEEEKYKNLRKEVDSRGMGSRDGEEIGGRGEKGQIVK